MGISYGLQIETLNEKRKWDVESKHLGLSPARYAACDPQVALAVASHLNFLDWIPSPWLHLAQRWLLQAFGKQASGHKLYLSLPFPLGLSEN